MLCGHCGATDAVRSALGEEKEASSLHCHACCSSGSGRGRSAATYFFVIKRNQRCHIGDLAASQKDHAAAVENIPTRGCHGAILV